MDRHSNAGTILLVGSVTTLVALGPLPASAAPCPVDPAVESPSPRLTTVDGSARLRFIQKQMDQGARSLGAWGLAWGLAFTAAATVQLALIPSAPSRVHPDLYVGGFSSATGALARAILFPRVLIDRRRLRRRVAEDPDACATVNLAERGLARGAAQERRGRHLFMHATVLLYNVGIGLTLAFAFDRPLPGNRQAAVGATVGQLVLITQPTTMVKALERYRRADVPSLARGWSTVPLVVAGGGGLGVAGSF